MAGSLFNVGRYFSKKSDSDYSVVSEQSTNQVTTTTTPTLSSNQQNPPADNVELVSKKEEVKTTAGTSPDQAQIQTPEQPSTLEKRAGMDVLSRLTQRSNKALVSVVTK